MLDVVANHSMPTMASVGESSQPSDPLPAHYFDDAPAHLWLLPVRAPEPVERELYAFGLQPEGLSVLVVFAGIVKGSLYYMRNTASTNITSRAVTLGLCNRMQASNFIKYAEDIDFQNNNDFVDILLRVLWQKGVITHSKRAEGQAMVRLPLNPLVIDSTSLTQTSIDAAGLTLLDMHALRVITTYLDSYHIDTKEVSAVGAPLGQSLDTDKSKYVAPADIIVQWSTPREKEGNIPIIRPVLQIRRDLLCFPPRTPEQVSQDMQNIICGLTPWDMSLSKDISTRELQSSADSFNPGRLPLRQLVALLEPRNPLQLKPREKIYLVSKQQPSGASTITKRYVVVKGDGVAGAGGLCSVPLTWARYTDLIRDGHKEIRKSVGPNRASPAAEPPAVGARAGSLPNPKQRREPRPRPGSATTLLPAGGARAGSLPNPRRKAKVDAGAERKVTMAALSLTSLGHGSGMAIRPARGRSPDANPLATRGQSVPDLAYADPTPRVSPPRDDRQTSEQRPSGRRRSVSRSASLRRLAAEGAAPERTASESAAPGRAGFERAESDRAVRARAAPERTASERSTLHRATLERAASERTGSARFAPERVSPERATLLRAASEYVTLENTASGEATPESTTPAPEPRRRKRKPDRRPAPEPERSDNTKQCAICGSKLNRFWQRTGNGDRVCRACFNVHKTTNPIPGRFQQKAPSDEKLQCYACGTESTALWRWDLDKRHRLCNSCGLRVRRHESSSAREAERARSVRARLDARSDVAESSVHELRPVGRRRSSSMGPSPLGRGTR